MAGATAAPGRGEAAERLEPGADRPLVPIGHAIALGALQGVAELLPISSSGHLTLVPALLGWRYAELDANLRKAFEVAVHAGSAIALAGALRDDLEVLARQALGAALALAPPALVGMALERRFDERLAQPRSIAAMQIVAGAALALADRRPATRRYGAARSLDHLVLGLAQAAALVPGVSRNGSTLTGARLRRFNRPSATRLSRQAALPVVAGAAMYKGGRQAREGLPRELRRPFAAGFAAALLSTLASRPLLARMAHARTYAPLGLYRMALGTVGLVSVGVTPRFGRLAAAIGRPAHAVQ